VRPGAAATTAGKRPDGAALPCPAGVGAARLTVEISGLLPVEVGAKFLY